MRLHHAGLVQLCLLSRMDQHRIASMGDSLVREVEVVMLYIHIVIFKDFFYQICIVYVYMFFNRSPISNTFLDIDTSIYACHTCKICSFV